MRTNATKRASFALALLLAVTFVFALGFTVYDGVTFAADATPQLETEITVGHMSDIHYFPLEYCYTTDVDSDVYKATDFYYAMTGDTKLVLESGMTLNAAIKSILKDADDQKAPQYLVTSGDLCKNGERVALIDVANTLRYLQNEMRKKAGYSNFQVFATVGNHDLYNQNGEIYSKEDGSGRVADILNSAQFALVFAGLGYPDATLDGANGTVNLTDYLPADYWSSAYTNGYVTSANATNIKYHYYSADLAAVESAATSAEKMACYYNLGDGLGQLTYIAELTDSANKGYSFIAIDSSDRELSETGAPSRISKAEYNALSNKPQLVVETNGIIDTKHPVSDSVAFANANNKVYRLTKYTHITGGRITEDCLEWIEAYASTQTGDKTTLGEETMISTFHHNVLPHFEQEDDILKDFTLYNWEYTAKRFLDMGIRYALTGHMHASDIMTYTDVEGRTLYDFETGSTISYASARRYIAFKRFNCDGKLGEQTHSSVNILSSLKEVSDNISTTADWNQSAMDAYKANPTDANWNALLAANPEYLTYCIRYDELSSMSYNEFISKDIYSIIVERMVNHFITDRTLDSLKDTVGNVLVGLDSSMVGSILSYIKVNGDLLNKGVQYILDVVLNSLYGEGGYPYNGKTYDTALDYVHAIIDDVLNLQFGDESISSAVNPDNKGKMNVKQIASFIMMSHSAGTEISRSETNASIDSNFTENACGSNTYGFMQPTDKTYRKRMLAAIKDLDTQLKNGQFVDTLLNMLLDPLFNNEDSLLKTLINYSFDLRNAVTSGFMTQSEYDKLEAGFRTLSTDKTVKLLIKNVAQNEYGITLPSDFTLNVNAQDFCLGRIINDLLPVAKPLIADMMGFNMDGDNLIGIVANLLDSYVTPSFKVGLGGIADNIVMAFATDVYPDLADMNDPTADYIIQPYAEYKFGTEKMSYVSSKNVMSSVGATFNAATQANGRVPSRVTSNFDTKNSTTSYTFKFYTEENVYGTFKYKTSADSAEWTDVVSTSKADCDMNADYIDSVKTHTKNGVTVTMLTQTKPVYLPLIDLGLACLTHGEIEYDIDKNNKDIPFVYGDRDNAAKNSVVYWNVTTVTVTGLTAGTTYYYDLEGSYANGSKMAQFSLAQNSGKQYYTFTTAADDSVTAFEFLTIADIQGMIQGMYDDSYNAVKALLADERTKDFDFILNAGDMCDNGKNFNQWAYALNTYQDLFANSSMFFTSGNHEDGSNAMLNYFNYTLPTGTDNKPLQKDNLKDGVFYSFNYANAHFVVLNTNDANSSGLGEVQLNWLTNDLANSTAKWKFVLMHKSLYSGGSHSTDAEVVAMRKQLVPLFKQYGVNIVFGGHDHTYTSTYLLDGNGNITDKSKSGNVQYTSGDGVLYITLGTMGTKFYNYKENPDVTPKFDGTSSILHTLDTQTFGKVVVDGDTLTYTGYLYNRETNAIEVIHNENAPKTNTLAIVLGIIIPVVIIAAVVIVLAVLKKKGVIGKKNSATEGNGNETQSADADCSAPQTADEPETDSEPIGAPEEPKVDSDTDTND